MKGNERRFKGKEAQNGDIRMTYAEQMGLMPFLDLFSHNRKNFKKGEEERRKTRKRLVRRMKEMRHYEALSLKNKIPFEKPFQKMK